MVLLLDQADGQKPRYSTMLKMVSRVMSGHLRISGIVMPSGPGAEFLQRCLASEISEADTDDKTSAKSEEGGSESRSTVEVVVVVSIDS